MWLSTRRPPTAPLTPPARSSGTGDDGRGRADEACVDPFRPARRKHDSSRPGQRPRPHRRRGCSGTRDPARDESRRGGALGPRRRDLPARPVVCSRRHGRRPRVVPDHAGRGRRQWPDRREDAGRPGRDRSRRRKRSGDCGGRRHRARSPGRGSAGRGWTCRTSGPRSSPTVWRRRSGGAVRRRPSIRVLPGSTAPGVDCPGGTAVFRASSVGSPTRPGTRRSSSAPDAGTA